MSNDPKRNISTYQEGVHVNEYEYQKNQSEMAEESKTHLTDDNDEPNLTQAEHVAEVTAEAHRKVEARK